MTFMLFRTAATAIAAALLTACGGGTSSSGMPGVTPRVPANTPTPASTQAPAAAATLKTAQINGAPAFVAANGLTVYIFDADRAAPGTSVCNGACAVEWPPVAPPAGVHLTAGFATIARADGTTQLTYNGRPLYRYIGDNAPGQGNGDGILAFGGLWHVSRPAGASTGTSPNPPSGY